MIQFLWIAGSAPLIILGSIHLYYTFCTNKFNSRNQELDIEMKTTAPVLTKSTTMWKSWIGFNASHSSGAIYIGLINLFFACQHMSVVLSPAFMLFNIFTVLFYLWLSKKYWFRIPFIGILIANFCFVSAGLIRMFTNYSAG